MELPDIAQAGKPENIVPVNDQQRLAALFRYEILDTPPEAFFDRITRLASKLLQAPSAFISLVDKDRVWYKSNLSPLDVACVDREDSLCSLTIINNAEVTVFEDTHTIPGLMESPYVSAPGGIRFYAGAPLITHDNFNIGTVCVVDSEPRSITEEDKEILRDLAVLVIEQIELRAMTRKAVRRHDELYSNLAKNLAAPLLKQNQLLSKADETTGDSSFLKQAKVNADMLQQSLQSMLEETVQEDTIVLQQKLAPVSAIARTVAHEYEPLAKAKKQEFYFTVASRRELPIDANLVREALANLVSATIKYAPKGSSIGLDIYESEGRYIIEVSSESTVLTLDDMQKLFLKYAILTGKATGNETVSGLELSRAQRIINLHNGTIKVEPFGKDNGVKFSVVFNYE